MDTLHQGRRGGLPASESGWDVQIALLDHLAKKSGASPITASGRCAATPLHFTYSKAMAWVAFDRALKSAEMFGLPGDGRALAQAVRRDPRRCLPSRAGTQKRNSFTRSYGSERPRRQPAAARADRLPQAGRSALSRHRRGDRARSRRRRPGAALRLAEIARTACRPAKARSSPAASGSPTPICCSAAATTPSACSADWSRCATTSDC